MAILTTVAIGFFVALISAFLGRGPCRFYYFAVGVVFCGMLLSLWGYQKKGESADQYVSISTQLLAFELEEGNGPLVVKTISREYFISPSYLTLEERERLASVDRRPSDATVWVAGEGSRTIKGLESSAVQIDRYNIVEIDSEFYRRLANVGFIISGLGVFLFVLRYFTPRTPPATE